jgi:hypothetical protein
MEGICMATLSEKMLAPEARPQVLKDCVQVLDEEVARKSGLTGMAIKAGYGVLKKVKPNMVEEAMDSLLDDFVHKLEPIHTEYVQSGQVMQLEQYLQKNSLRIANTLLEITDSRGKNAKNPVIKKTYDGLRPYAVKQIEEAMPAVARLVKKHV